MAERSRRRRSAGRRARGADLSGFSDEQLGAIYRSMRRIRRFEEVAGDAYLAAKMRGALHFYIGQEASAVGVCTALQPDDYITSTHRGHGHCIAKGGRMDKMMAELFGRATGYCGGKGGSMHIADVESGNLGANGIVGAGLPIGVGAALSSKLQRDGRVTVSFFGDAAGPTGAFHEAVNMAVVFELPIVFWCENNQYGMATKSDFANAGGGVACKADGYGIPGEIVDGNDVFAVYEVAARAVERARRGQGPSLIEAKTYRLTGHTIHDQKPYRTTEEIESWRRLDPIERFRSAVSQTDRLPNDAISDIDASIDNEAQHALDFAEASPWPIPDVLERDVYAD